MLLNIILIIGKKVIEVSDICFTIRVCGYKKLQKVFKLESKDLEGICCPLLSSTCNKKEAWTEIHQDELQKAWERLQSGKLPEPIEPLH